jgi:hypothetical protein
MALTLAGDGTVTGLDWGASGGGLTLITTQSFTAVSSVSVNDCFTSEYDNYRIVISSSAVVGSGGLTIKMRSAGTDASTNYQYIINGRGDGNSVLSAVGASATSGLLQYGDPGNAVAFDGVVDVIKPFAAVSTRMICTAIGTYANATWGVTQNGSVHHYVATSYDGFTLTPAAAASGTVRVYGYTQ